MSIQTSISGALATAALLLFLLPVPATAADPAESPSAASSKTEAATGSAPLERGSCHCSESVCSITVLWDEINESKPEMVLDREFLTKNACFVASSGAAKNAPMLGITAGTSLRITIKDFNFLKYEIRFEKQEELIEAYAQLDKLWGQILGLGGLVGMAAGSADETKEKDAFLEALIAWDKGIGRLYSTIRSELNRYPKSYLSSTQVGAIASASIGVQLQIANLGELEKKVLDSAVIDAPKTPTDAKFRLIQELREKQTAVVEQADTFVQRAGRVADGGKKIIEGTKVGNVVTATFTAVERNNSSEDRTFAVKYFVRSRLPVVFHGGYGQTSLDDFEFEKVRTADGLEAYDLVKDDTTKEDFMVFLSIPFYRFDEREKFALLATLGTGLSKPGENLFAGISAKLYSRFLISYGVMSSEVAEGVHPFVDEVGSALDSRELFATIDKRRDWGSSWAISFLVDF